MTGRGAFFNLRKNGKGGGPRNSEKEGTPLREEGHKRRAREGVEPSLERADEQATVTQDQELEGGRVGKGLLERRNVHCHQPNLTCVTRRGLTS